MTQLIVRNSALTEVNTRLRLIDLVAVPYEEQTEVIWRGEPWREVFDRSSFAGIEGHAGTVRVNREHQRGRTVGKVVSFHPSHEAGLLAHIKIARTPLGDETLALAEEDMISPSIGYWVKQPSHVQVNKRTRTRRVMKAILDHIGMVESPAFAGAQVLAVRQSRLTPALDALKNDEVFQWAASRTRSL